MFFTAVNPIDIQLDRREVEYDLDTPRIAPYKHTWTAHHNTENWCNLKLAQRKELRFYQTRLHAIALVKTLLAIYIVNVVCMKTSEELHCRMYKSPRLFRVTLVPNSQHIQKDVHVSESRNSDCRIKFISTGRPVAVTIVLIFESLAFHIPMLNKLKQTEKKQFDNSLSNSKVTHTGTCC